MAETTHAARQGPPAAPTGTITLQPPPEMPPSDGISGLLASMLPMLGSLGSIVMVTMNMDGNRGYLTAGMFLLTTLGFVGVNGWRQRQQRMSTIVTGRREYFAYLSETRKTVREAAEQQRARACWVHPEPSAFPAIVEERTRLWERQPRDKTFLDVRVGTSQQPLRTTIEPPEVPTLAQLDPVAASAAHRFLTTHSELKGIPVGVSMLEFSRMQAVGDPESDRALVRAMLVTIASLHSPEDVVIAVLATDELLPQWEWVKWLPHAQSTRVFDAVGSGRMIASDIGDLLAMLPEDISERPRFAPATSGGEVTPHVVLVVDHVRATGDNALFGPEGPLGVTIIEMPSEWSDLSVGENQMRVIVAPATEERAGGELIVMSSGGVPFSPDQLSLAEAEATARRLAPYRFAGDIVTESDEVVSMELTDLLGLPDVREIDFGVTWRPRYPRDRLRVPIGVGTNGRPVALDIKESAQQGMGPHGLIIGATGSGKSEVLRTLVLALALTHSPEALNFVLVDFKGGATFAGMADMPHVSAVITNLGEELALVDRMEEALRGEMVRRQELLRAAGNFQNVSDYEKARTQQGRTDLDPLPALLIVADEFSELLSAKEEFTELFVAIGRLGRSLQIHLLLASQRLEEQRLRGLDSHLSYRVGLRTFSESESRSVIGTPDAYHLPPLPGVGLLKAASEGMTQFRASYVSAPPKPLRRSESMAAMTQQTVVVEPFVAAPVISANVPLASEGEKDDTPEPEPVNKEQRTIFDIAVSRMHGLGTPAHQVWLPPLDVPETLDALMPDLAVHPTLGLTSVEWRSRGPLTVPAAIVDLPLEQRRETLSLTLTGSAGHLAFVGGPRTGKSTALRTVVAAMALTNTPIDVQFYVLDFGGGTFTGMVDLAHMAGVATRAEPDVIRRIVAEITSIINKREKYFRAHRIDSIDTYRAQRAAGKVDDGYGDIFLVVDGWNSMRSDFDELELDLHKLAGRGLTFGVHMLVSGTRWMDFRPQIKDLLGTRIEFRLGDPMDSEVDRKSAPNVPKGRPGRGITPFKKHMLMALPRVDRDSNPDTTGDGVADLVRQINAAYHGPPGPKLQLLPERIDLDTLLSMPEANTKELVLAIDEANLEPVSVNPGTVPHLYVFGDSKSGKSSFLRAFAREVMRLYSPEQAQIIAFDYRRSLLGEIPDEYLAGYLTTSDQARDFMVDLAGVLKARLPGPDVTPEQLRDRSWWTGSEVFIIVDDYDLVATSTGNPLGAIQPFLAQATDVGLHLLLARRAGGASRSLYEPVIQTIRDLAAPGILLSGNPDEGPLIGKVKPKLAIAGRATMVSNEGTTVMHMGYTPPVFGAEADKKASETKAE